jgi:hypothetical protein
MTTGTGRPITVRPTSITVGMSTFPALFAPACWGLAVLTV